MKNLFRHFTYYATPFFLISIVIYIQFHGISGEQVLKIHDQYFPTSLASALQNLSPVSRINNGISNVFMYVIHFPDSLFYASSYLIGLAPRQAEAIYMISMLYIGYILFSRGIYLLLDSSWRVGLSVIAGIAYLTSPFLIITYNTGVFWSLTNTLAISLLPLALYFYLKFQDSINLKLNNSCANSIWLGGISAVYLYSVTYLIPYLLMIFVATGWRNINIFQRSSLRPITRALLTMLGLGCPAIVGYLSEGLHLFNDLTEHTELINSAAKNIVGGMTYQVAQFSSWAIYTPWPRVFLGFDGYFDGWLYKIAVAGVSVSAGYVFIKSTRIALVSRLFVLALAAFFLSKGGGAPFGGIYDWLLENIFIFATVRSPDTKFGLISTFSVLLICFIGSNELVKKGKKRTAILILLPTFLLMSLSSYFILHGKIIRGDSDLLIGSNFVQDIGSDQVEAANFLNSKKLYASVVFFNWAGIYNYGERRTIALSEPLADLISNKYYTSPKISMPFQEKKSYGDIKTKRLNDDDCDVCYGNDKFSYGVINKHYSDYEKIYQSVKSKALGSLVLDNSSYYIFEYKNSKFDKDIVVENLCDYNLVWHYPWSFWTVNFEKGCNLPATFKMQLNNSRWWDAFSIDTNSKIPVISKLKEDSSLPGWTVRSVSGGNFLIVHDLEILILASLFVFIITFVICIYRLFKWQA